MAIPSRFIQRPLDEAAYAAALAKLQRMRQQRPPDAAQEADDLPGPPGEDAEALFFGPTKAPRRTP